MDEFIRTFDHDRDVFVARAIGTDEAMETLIGSDDTDYVMRRIREKYLSGHDCDPCIHRERHVGA